MKLSSIPQAYRNVNRLKEIFGVLSRYGLADWFSRLQVEFAKDFLKDPDGEALARHTREARIRLALTELGPTFIKLGQLLSTRPDVVGRPLAIELKALQDSAPADSPALVRQTIEEELGQPATEVFAEFSDEPLAAASIGQVHAAVLPNGQRAVVKVQRSGIAKMIRRDLEVLGVIAQLMARVPEFLPYRPVETLAEMQRVLLRELDFGREERNLQHFAARFEGDPRIQIPLPFSEWCTPRVLTMEMIQGAKLSSLDRLDELGFDREKVARNGADLYAEMIFDDGFYHADPHPGNVMLLPGNVIGLLDFGMVGRIDEPLREDVEEIMLAIVQQDSAHLATVISRLGKTPSDLDRAAFRTELTEYVSHYATQQLDQFDLAGALSEMIDIVHRYRISLPPQISMLIKTLVTLEGTATALSPSFSLAEVIQPMQRKALMRRLSPQRRIKKMRRVYMELEHLAAVLPRRTMDILEQIQSGNFDVHLDHRGLEPSVNRLVLGLLTSALFVGSALMLSQKVPPLLLPGEGMFGVRDLSVLGLMGCALSFLIGLRLLRAIGKSGHLDRRD
jgi:ubiquinone biosynthesis protein